MYVEKTGETKAGFRMFRRQCINVCISQCFVMRVRWYTYHKKRFTVITKPILSAQIIEQREHYAVFWYKLTWQ